MITVTCPCCGEVFEVDENGEQPFSIDIDVQAVDDLSELGIYFGVAEGGVSIEGQCENHLQSDRACGEGI